MVGPANPYSGIDPIIKSWVERLGSYLFTDFAGQPRRYFHIPGQPPYECFQVSIKLSDDGLVQVFACAIDTNDGTESELELDWHGSVAQLDTMIAAAVAAVEGWKAREIRPGYSSGSRFSADGTPLAPSQNH